MLRHHSLTRIAIVVAGLALSAPAPAALLDFEDLGLNLPIANPDTGDPEDFYNGYSAFAAGEETDFSTEGATFRNDFQAFPGFTYWEGWSYSQTTDTTTAGFGNQYSAWPGSGAGGSETYGVAYTAGGDGTQRAVSRISFDREVSIAGAWFTNTTYAALSMQEGDGFAKKFGGDAGDDPDFFTLLVHGIDGLGGDTGTVEFALADYTFADDALDYIVEAWIWVDLAGLGEVAALEFELLSSDTNEFGNKTPSYFAMDGLHIVPEPASAALFGLGLGLLAGRRRR